MDIELVNRLTLNVEEASKEESAEILQALSELSEDDLKIVSSQRIYVE